MFMGFHFTLFWFVSEYDKIKTRKPLPQQVHPLLHTHCPDSGQYKIFEDSEQRIFQHIYCVPPAIVLVLYCLNANAL